MLHYTPVTFNNHRKWEMCYRINALVEQEVKRRMFEEKLQREQKRQLERDREKREREEEIKHLKDAHHREIKQLKAKYERRWATTCII